jgi:predicted porin
MTIWIEFGQMLYHPRRATGVARQNTGDLHLHLKRTLIPAAAAVLAAVAPAVHAQSSLTISGILDTGLLQTKTYDGARMNRLTNGFKSSRLKFGGSEDLGGGLRASFLLEEGITVATGTVSSFGGFHRASWVGLSGPDWGALRLGKALTPTSRAVCALADLHDCGGGFNNSGIFYNGTNNYGRWISVKPGRGGNNNASMSAFSGGGTGTANSSDSGRVANAAFYDSPLLGGFQASLVYALGEAPANNVGNGDHGGAGLAYTGGPVKLSLNYEHTNPDPLWKASGQLWTLGGLYTMGEARIGAVYQQETASGVAALWTRAAAWALTGAYRMGSFEPYVKLGAHRTNGTGAYGIVNGVDDKMLEIGTTYALSKRTVLYMEYATDRAGHEGTGADRVNPRQVMAGMTLYF